MQLVRHVFPSGIMGLVIVVMVAALISTIGSALNSLSTVFTMDIYLKKFRPNATDKEILSIGRWVILAGAVLAIFLAIAITFIQGLSFFNIFQSVLSFIAPPMSAAFLFAALWKKTSAKAVNIVLTAGTVFSLGLGILYYCGLIFQNMHYLYLSAIIFAMLGLFIWIYSLACQSCAVKSAQEGEVPVHAPIKVTGGLKVAWILLVVVMVGIYIFFN